MDTAAISYRVIDFLKKYPPFTGVPEEALLALTAGGRVRFYEAGEYLSWQGEPHRSHVFVIQQGTVSLWDESSETGVLRDVRGSGDLLGVERYHDVPAVLFSSRAETDVVVYGFSAFDFDALVSSDERVRRFINAGREAALDASVGSERRDPSRVYLHQLAGGRLPATCPPHEPVHVLAGRLAGGTDAVAVVDTTRGLMGVVDQQAVVSWVSRIQPGESALAETVMQPLALARPDSTIADGALALAEAASGAIAITDDGSPQGRVLAVVTRRDFAGAFGDDPASLIERVRHASGLDALRDLNRRTRDLTMSQLTGPASVDWLTRFVSQFDTAVIERIVALLKLDASGCWCACGPSGRVESLTRMSPQVAFVSAESGADPALRDRMTDALVACDFLPQADTSFPPSFYVASAAEWSARFEAWISNPVVNEMYRARAFFDLRPLAGDVNAWQQVDDAVTASVDHGFKYILANDCMATLPPLTFFEDVVVDATGEQTSVFLLEETALQPLVDVGRVLGIVAGMPLGRSTFERLTRARAEWPDQEALFREAADTLRILLWQQGKVGLAQGTSGASLPPSLLSRHDRQVLKGAFGSILRLLRFASEPTWLSPA